MTDHALLNAIASVKGEIATKEKSRKPWVESLADLDKLFKGGVIAPTYQDLQKECNEELGKLDAELATLRKKLDELEARLPQKANPPALKFDPEKHPLLRKSVEKAEPVKPVSFNTGDICEVQWSVDKGWYKAKILSVMGSSADPKYTVRFIQYDETVTVDRKAVRPLAGESRKRKAEEPATTTIQPATKSQIVISGPASINPAAQAAANKDATNNAQDRPKNRRKIGGEKALDRKKNNWKDFQAKNAKTSIQKESMFRTGTGLNSRVGFTGSGAGMTKTTARIRPNRANAELEDDEPNSPVNPPRGRDRDDRSWRPNRDRY